MWTDTHSNLKWAKVLPCFICSKLFKGFVAATLLKSVQLLLLIFILFSNMLAVLKQCCKMHSEMAWKNVIYFVHNLNALFYYILKFFV